jgi:signal transduction histidine kinase
VAIVNAPAGAGAGVVPGAGRGLAGLTERVAAAGGTFSCGPTSHGGWQLSARLPR